MLSALFIAYILLRSHFNPALAPAAPSEPDFAWRNKLAFLKGLIFPILLVFSVVAAILSVASMAPRAPTAAASAMRDVSVYLKGVAPAGVTMGDLYRSIVPFVALMILGLGICMAVPDIILLLPKMLF